MLEHRRRFRDRGAVVPRLRCAEMDTRSVTHHRLAPSKRPGAGWDDVNLVTERAQLANCRGGNERFDFNITPRERVLPEPAGLERFLYRHAVIGDVRHELGVRLRLIEAAHNPEPDAYVAFLHER